MNSVDEGFTLIFLRARFLTNLLLISTCLRFFHGTWGFWQFDGTCGIVERGSPGQVFQKDFGDELKR